MKALVTGAGGRLGAVMAEELGRLGYDVALHYSTSAAGAEAVAKAITGHGQKAVCLQADLLDLAACDALVPRAAEALGGPLTLLINNASIFEHDDMRTATHESWDRHIGSNLRAPFILTQAFAAQAPEAETDGRPRASAAIINMIDQRVRKLTPEFMTYTLAKSALWTMTQTTAQALAPAIRVNAIGPGPTMQGVRQSADHFAAQQAATVLQRGADPSDILEAMRYLISAPAITGQLICVDGGQHLAWQTPDVLGVE
ncbi:short chain dehydrogenase [Jannaschia pagri]|uniref:Short chain dehydrogenase n=1 Tax=Jannaschia pagri TaxID=2829797 RepID=A0ABQ4NIU0_9RHOB|nr:MULTISPECIES: SDR family oxidoreductase [unclassified Jannaschia]GIT89646.1 short chain dehydrogenase [Jannaschia sp. AI_61]GIT94246.1 short chain dehydrogenase [Jannaschia sp. AI_62]